ncbi:MAG: hypothetical protein ACLFO1_09160 [Spirochaetaceae bacterium]
MHRLGFVRYVIAIVAFAAVVGAPAFGGTSTVTESLVLAPSPRTAAIGGLHTTLADGYDTLTANPAGFRAVPAGIQAAEVTMRLSGPVLSLSSIILEAVDEGFETVFASPETLSELQRLYASVGLFGPISFGFVGDGLGFAVSNTTDVTLRTVGTTELSAVAKEGLLLSGGFALRMPLPERAGELDTGVLLKGFVQGASRVETSLLALPDLFTSFDTDLILEAPFDVATGLSVDVGVRYQILPWLAFGLTGQNLLAPAIVNTYDSLTGFLDNEDAVSETDARIPINVSAGVAFTPGLGSLDRHISGFKVLLDYRDGLDFWTDPDNVENPLLKIALGVETTLLDVVSVRLGLAEGLPAAGLGLDLGVVEIDAVAFGDELTGEPGFRSIYNLMFGVRFGSRGP